MSETAPAIVGSTEVHERTPAVRVATPDGELVERAARGDQDAFRALVERHRDHAYGLALRITRSPDEAQEAAQEAFVRAWRALRGFRGDAAFGTWLHRIVARRALDRAMARRQRTERETGLDAAEAASLARTAERRDHLLARRLERLTARLSPAQRAVVSLFYEDGCPVQEIATVLGMPEGTVKTHLYRARAALRAAWMRVEGGAS